MNTQEKAEELILLFTPYMYCYMGSGMLTDDYDRNIVLDFAKKCSIISVNQILKALKVPPIKNEGSKLYDSQIDYWNEVKVFIESYKYL